MNILITGTSKGIGRETALYFLSKGHVYGIDILESSIKILTIIIILQIYQRTKHCLNYLQ